MENSAQLLAENDALRSEVEALRLREALALEYGRRVQIALDAGAIIGTWNWHPLRDRFTVDANFARSFGTDPALIQQDLTLDQVLETVHPEDRPGLDAAIAETVERGGPYAHMYRVRRADGNYYWIEANGRVDFGPDGKPYSFPGILIGVDERRSLEAERDRSSAAIRSRNDDLEQRVEARTAELMRAEEQLRQSQKLEAIGQLTGGVAHDFNNLLTVIKGSVELLQRPSVTDDRRKLYIAAINDATSRAASLTAQLLAFARRQALTPEVFDAGESLTEVANMVRTLAGSRIELNVITPKQAISVLADRNQLDTAIVNMAVNARDAMNGVGKLTIAVGAVSGIPPLRAHPAVAGDFVAVTVSDTGTGIAADELGRIFEPFFTTKVVGQGTGLGLSQVIGFAKQSGGDIRVESEVGSGTTFTMYLPRAYPDGAVQAAPEEDYKIDGEGIRVLVVEDNPTVGNFAVEALTELGYDSMLAPDARYALDILAQDQNRFQIVFSDVVMPGMDGMQLGEEIRRLYPELPVILTSGYSHVLSQNGQHGFELLHKPYSVEQLSRVLRKAIAWKQTLQRKSA